MFLQFLFERGQVSVGAEFERERVPDLRVVPREGCCCVLGFFVFCVLVWVWDVVVLLVCVSGVVFVDFCCPHVLVIVFWSVVLVCGVDEWVHFCAGSEYVEICHVEDVEFLHQWFGVCSGWLVLYDSDDLLLCPDEWL